jgi:hypothetical protein
MTDNPNDDDFDNEKFDIDQISVIDKIDILITLIENGPKDRYKSLTNVLYEARFQLLHAWNEVEYYMELCEGYERAIKQVGDKLK